MVIATLPETNPTFHYFWQLFQSVSIPVIEVQDIDYQRDTTYIIMIPGEHPTPPTDRKAQVIAWDLEPYHYSIDKAAFDQVWTFSQRSALRNNFRFVPITCSGQFPDSTRTDGAAWDVSHISSAVPRRQHIYEQLDGLRVSGYGLWGEHRHEVLKHSRMMLNVFPYDDFQTISPTRPNMAAIYHMPLICEAGLDLMGLQDVVIQKPYDELAAYLKRVTDAELEDYGERLYQHCCVDHAIEKVIAANV